MIVKVTSLSLQVAMLQIQTAVPAYISSKHLPQFGFECHRLTAKNVKIGITTRSRFIISRTHRSTLASLSLLENQM